MTTARIRYAFEAPLKTWAAARSPALPLVLQNVAAAMPTVAHLRGFLLPANTVSQDLAGEHRGYRGVYQISIFGKPGIGPGWADGVVAALDDLFPASEVLTRAGLTIYIARPVSAAPALTEPDWYHVPVTIGYQAEDI